MIRLPYIKVELVYRHHKSKWFHHLLDTGSYVTMVSTQSYPERYRKDVFGQLVDIHDTTTDMH